MADQFGLFWNSINADRTYDADSFAEWLRKFFTTGVFNGEMQVVPDSGMVVNVQPGYININGKVKFFDSVQAFTIEPASGVYPRIDTIVVRCDSTNRIITTEYVKGDYSGNAPVPTAPVRTGGIYEVVLAQIQVNAGATQILVNNITDTRADDDLCGWVTSTVEGVPMDQIVSQMQAQFLTWFDHMKDQLDEDAAGHLQQEIDQISAAVTSIGNAVQVHTSDFAINEGEGTAASRAYSVGEFLMWYNGLRKVTAPIAQGDPITDQNTADTKVGDELTSLKNGLTPQVVNLSASEMTLPAGVTLYRLNYLTIIGKIVILNFSIRMVNVSGQQNIANFIPNAYKPANTTNGTSETGLGDGKCQPVTISPDRSMTVYPVNSGTTYAIGSLVYAME